MRVFIHLPSSSISFRSFSFPYRWCKHQRSSSTVHRVPHLSLPFTHSSHPSNSQLSKSSHKAQVIWLPPHSSEPAFRTRPILHTTRIPTVHKTPSSQSPRNKHLERYTQQGKAPTNMEPHQQQQPPRSHPLTPYPPSHPPSSSPKDPTSSGGGAAENERPWWKALRSCFEKYCFDCSSDVGACCCCCCH